MMLANDFMSFFTNKIKEIHGELQKAGEEGSQSDTLMPEIPCQTLLQTFDEATAEEVRTLILKATNKQCPLDPLPTWLLKVLLEQLFQ